MAVLSKLALQISTKGGDSVKRELNAIDKQAKKTGKGMNTVFSPKMAAAFAAGITAAVAEVTRSFNEWLQVMDKIQKQSLQTGLAPELIDAMRLVEKFSGLTQDTMTRTFLYFKRQVGSGLKDTVIREFLGLTPEQMEQQKEDVIGLWADIVRDLNRMSKDDPRKNYIVNQLFGEDGGRELLKFLNQSESGMAGTLDKAIGLANATQDSVDSAAEFNDNVTELSERWQNLLENAASNDDPLGLGSLIRQANDLIQLLDTTRQIADEDPVLGSLLSGPGTDLLFAGGVGDLASGLNQLSDARALADDLKSFMADTGESFAAGWSLEDRESQLSRGNLLLSRQEALRRDYISRNKGFMGGSENAAQLFDMFHGDNITQLKQRIEEIAADQAEVDELRLKNIEKQKAAEEAFATNYAAGSGGAFGIAGVPWRDSSGIIMPASRPEAGFDPMQAALDAAYDPESERLAQQKEYEEMAKAMGDEVADALADSSLLPEASMWTDMLDDLRQGNAILQSIDDGIQVIQRKEGSKIGVVK